MSRICVLAVLPLLFALGLNGDTIELKTGERLERTFRQANATGTVIEAAGQPITIPLEKIRAIYFGVAPTRTVADPAPFQEALDALKALRSVTQSGIAYREYSTRVLDAKVKVDRYVSLAKTDAAEFRGAIGLAMREYELASQAWSTTISTSMRGLAVATNVGMSLDEDPEVSKCPAIRQMIDQMDRETGKSRLLRSMGQPIA